MPIEFIPGPNYIAPTPAAGDSSNRAASTGFVASATREKLTVARAYYVRTDGSDSNTGLANTTTGAFLTIQKAWDTIADTLDLQGFTVTTQIGDGTYAAGIVTSKTVVGGSGPEGVIFQGNASTPANVLISVTNSYCFCASASLTSCITQFTVKDMELRVTSSGNCIMAAGFGVAINFGNIIFGACAGTHIWAQHGAWVYAISDYAVSGSATFHIESESSSVAVFHGRTITFSNSPVFTDFARALYAAQVHIGSCTFTNGGTVTGTRYLTYANGVIETFGGGANYLPGNVAGFVVYLADSTFSAE